ncbi:MAG: hypothetical protein ACM309_09715 [Bacillota bacterium]
MARMVDADTVAEVLGEIERLVDNAGLDDRGILGKAVDRLSAATVEAYTVTDISESATAYIDSLGRAFRRRVEEHRHDTGLRDYLETYLKGMRALTQDLRVWLARGSTSRERLKEVV